MVVGAPDSGAVLDLLLLLRCSALMVRRCQRLTRWYEERNKVGEAVLRSGWAKLGDCG